MMKVLVHVEDGEEGVRVGLDAVDFNGRADVGLGDDEFGEFGEGKEDGVAGKILVEEVLDRVEVHLLWIKELEIDVDDILGQGMRKYRTNKKKGVRIQ